MITFTLVAILGALLVIVLMNLFKKDPKPLPAPVRPVEDLANLKVTDARTGDVLSIAGAGDRMTDLDYTVDRGTRFEAGSRTWVELSGPYLDRRVSLRIGGDEEVEVFLHADPRKITLEDLGLSEDDLAQMDERQNPADSFDFDNVTWMYRLSREVRPGATTNRRPPASTTGSFSPRTESACWESGRPKASRLQSRCSRGSIAGDVTVYRKN